MIDIDVKNLKKSFEVGHDVLSGLSFEINAGEHVGILGANGCGKTTLFRLLTGEYTPDEGTIAIHKGRRIGLISQIPVYPAGWTTKDVLREAHARLRAMSDRLRELEELMSTRGQYAADSCTLPVVDTDERYAVAVAAPILSEGDVLGCVLFVAAHDDGPAGETERKLAQAVSGFLGKQMES